MNGADDVYAAVDLQDLNGNRILQSLSQQSLGLIHSQRAQPLPIHSQQSHPASTHVQNVSSLYDEIQDMHLVVNDQPIQQLIQQPIQQPIQSQMNDGGYCELTENDMNRYKSNNNISVKSMEVTPVVIENKVEQTHNNPFEHPEVIKIIQDTQRECKTVEEVAVHEFARKLWRTLTNIDVKTVSDDSGQPMQGFSGKELTKHIRKYLKNESEVKNQNKKEIVRLCYELLKHKYIRLIASAGQYANVDGFVNKDRFLYKFDNDKHRGFIKDDQPDRRAWTHGTKVQIFSATLGGWQKDGTVVDCKGDELTISYGGTKNQMRKTLNRYQEDTLVKSLPEFIEIRKKWRESSDIEVYSHGQHKWCSGVIQKLLPSNELQTVDIFRVFYNNNDFSKYVPRWSPDLRPAQGLSEKMRKYKAGTKVEVWSKHKKLWIGGIVIDAVPGHEVVNVRYGDHEKLVPIASRHIKLMSVNTALNGMVDESIFEIDGLDEP